MSAKLAADIICVRNTGTEEILLIKRGNEPFKGQYALPGGFLDEKETIEEAAIREAREETGLTVSPQAILGVYSTPSRDPRGHVVSVVFIMHVDAGIVQGGDDAEDAQWHSLAALNLNELAFDHNKIVSDYLAWKQKHETFWSTKKYRQTS